jgi:hypothetical protein
VQEYRAGDVALTAQSPEFKSQYCQKKKKIKIKIYH